MKVFKREQNLFNPNTIAPMIKKTLMRAEQLYNQFLVNLEIAKEKYSPMSQEIKSSVQSIGSFLRGRSSQFEVLENQEDISVFISVCKSERENLILVFNYFLSDSLIKENKKVSSSEFLKKLLEDFDRAVNGFNNAVNQTEPQSGFKVISGNNIIQKRESLKKK